MTRTPTEQPLGAADFEDFVSGLDYPLFVVTVAHDGRQAGCIVGFVTQVSIEPAHLLVCLSTRNHTYDVARHASVLAVHVLSPAQHDLVQLFGSETGDEVDKLARCRTEQGPDGVPLLQDCERRVVGRVLEQLPFGDHVGFVLEPIEVDVAGDGPAFSLQQAHDIEPGHRA